ncbi:hypothetical protein P8452_59633 [Trifolium repens]|nr:hypothetical protein P8452_59633 [Trifolium repens]
MRENVERSESARASGSKKGYLQHLDSITTSFFFTNLLEDTSTADLWKLFLKFGRVREVYIPKKLDKRGRRFGFVKYMEVAEMETLEESLREVWIGSFKLQINRSRFGRNESKVVPSQDNSEERSGVKVKEVVG